MINGNLQKADSIIENLPDESIYKAGLSIVNPKIAHANGTILKSSSYIKEIKPDLLLSEALWSCGKKDLALVSLARALKIAKRKSGCVEC